MPRWGQRRSPAQRPAWDSRARSVHQWRGMAGRWAVELSRWRGLAEEVPLHLAWARRRTGCIRRQLIARSGATQHSSLGECRSGHCPSRRGRRTWRSRRRAPWARWRRTIRQGLPLRYRQRRRMYESCSRSFRHWQHSGAAVACSPLPGSGAFALTRRVRRPSQWILNGPMRLHGSAAVGRGKGLDRFLPVVEPPGFASPAERSVMRSRKKHNEWQTDYAIPPVALRIH